jgi:hypothetical protein
MRQMSLGVFAIMNGDQHQHKLTEPKFVNFLPMASSGHCPLDSLYAQA